MDQVSAVISFHKELRHRHEKDMVIFTLVPQNHNCIRMMMNQRKCLSTCPPIDIAMFKLQVWKSKHPHIFFIIGRRAAAS